MIKINESDKKLIQNLAVRFATAVWLEVGTRKLIEIDQKNRTASPNVCASHDYTDANMTMYQVIEGAMLRGDISCIINKNDADCLQSRVWDYTKAVGFCRLRGIRSIQDQRLAAVRVEQVDNELRITQPTHSEPVLVVADYWGDNPRLQVMIYEADGSDEPVLKVRFTPEGKMKEVALTNTDGRRIPVFDDRHDTPWSKERDWNPACREGDLLLMPSGQYGEVMRLQDRYYNYEDYVRYDDIYQVAKRLIGSRTGKQIRRAVSEIDDLWNDNPLTVATTDPADLSIVPEDTTELPDPELILNSRHVAS